MRIDDGSSIRMESARSLPSKTIVGVPKTNRPIPKTLCTAENTATTMNSVSSNNYLCQGSVGHVFRNRKTSSGNDIVPRYRRPGESMFHRSADFSGSETSMNSVEGLYRPIFSGRRDSPTGPVFDIRVVKFSDGCTIEPR